MNKKVPNNCYIDKKGYLIPKSATINNSKEVLAWLKENQTKVSAFAGESFYSTTDPYISVNIGHSEAGFVYCTAMTESEEYFDRFTKNSDYVWYFGDDIEGFKKYITWVTTKLGPKFTKRFKNKQSNEMQI